MLSIQDIVKCHTLEEVFNAFEENQERTILAAGTDIVPMLRDGKLKDLSLIDLTEVEELRQLYVDYDHVLHIGAGMTHTEIAGHELIAKHLPALAMASAVVGSTQIRNRATIGGNICHASPAADTVPVLVAAGACVVLSSRGKNRVVLLEQFIKGPGKVDLKPGEVLKEVMIILPENGFSGQYMKIGGRSALTIATCSAAVLYDGTNYRVAVGSMSAAVKRLPLLESYLLKKENPEVKEIEVLLALSVSPITDVRATKEYRLKACAGLIKKSIFLMHSEH